MSLPDPLGDWDELPDVLAAQSEATERLVMLVWAGLFLALALFSAAPGLDLIVSAQYFDFDKGFVHAQDAWVRALYDWTPWIGRSLIVLMAVFAALAPLLAAIAFKQSRVALAQAIQGPWRRVATLMVCATLLGNGLIIEGVFKNAMARPRPVQVVQFGGPDTYMRPFRVGTDPQHHRSFVSSHAAAGFALMGLGLSCGPLWRRRWLLIGMTTGGLVGLGRILQGGHFLSDVVFAFYSVWLACEAVAWWDRRRNQTVP